MVRLALEQRLERSSPPDGERGNPQRPFELLARMRRQIQERIDLGYGHALGSSSDGHDRIARVTLAFLENAWVEARTAAGREEGRHSGLIHPDPDAIASDPRLAHFEKRAPNPITVADADCVVRQSLHREILTELPGGEVASAQPLLPVAMGFGLINEDRSLLSAMAATIPLAVAVGVDPSTAPAPLPRLLQDAGGDGLPPPLDVAR